MNSPEEQPEWLRKGNNDMSESSVKRTISSPIVEGGGLPPKVLGIMAMTTLLTFATLTASYQLFFSHSVFA